MGPGSHSPVGGSAIKRVLACPASVSLADGIEDEESEHAALGTAVHTLIEACFNLKIDAWERVGHGPAEGWPMMVTKQMANAAQVMLDAVRKAHPDRNQGNFWVERRFHCPTIHPLFFGTSDVVYLEENADRGEILAKWGMAESCSHGAMLVMSGAKKLLVVVHIWDYKNGAGVVIEVRENEQTSYYTCGVLEDLAIWDKVDLVVMHIVQPNGFHSDGPVRHWVSTPDELAAWLEDVLVPGINKAMQPPLDMFEEDFLRDTPPRLTRLYTVSGDHCRFCPTRTHACPQLMADMEELHTMVEEMKKTGAEPLTNEQLGRFLALLELGKIVGKAASSTAFARINGGGKVPGWKLAKSKANRVWKDDAEAAAKTEFGEAAYSKPDMLSPAKIDGLPAGTTFTARFAYKPDTGLTLVKDSDSRAEVSTDTKSLFTDVSKTKVAVKAPVGVLASVGVRRKKPTTEGIAA